MVIEQNIWGFTDEGEAVILYTMRNNKGASVQLTNIGATVVSIVVPDKEGRMGDVVLGYDNFKSYFNDGAAMGKTVGRYANRIAGGLFSIGGTQYRLPQNNWPNHLHGGPMGFGNRLWESRVETNRVVFSLISPDGDQGYPGELSVETIYDWDDDCTLEITMLAKGNVPTIVNLTNHTYFNLGGEASGNILAHNLRLNAEYYLPTDSTQIPTGEISPVEDTPMDFRNEKPVGQDIGADFEALKIGHGYDHCWVISGYRAGHFMDAGQLSDPISGRVLTILTTQPGVQVYTGNFLQGLPTGKGRISYSNRDGIAIECQGFPDAPNHLGFPSQQLNPDDIYEQHIIYKFSTD